MDGIVLAKALIALLPVIMLLFLFDRLDVFNLIPMRLIGVLLGVGGAIAALSFLANWRVMDGFPIGTSDYSRYVAPLIEESLKAAPIVWLFASNRIGFKLDAAIAGFAVGAGFSAIENIWYLVMLPEANITAWLVRGFGTAIMHGGATALFAVISHEMTERQAESAAAAYRFNPLLFLPGLAVAISVHSGFNHFPGQPLLVMAATLLLIPATLFLTFARNETAARQWLRTDHARHAALLADIRAGQFEQTPAAQALHALAAKMAPSRADAVFQHAALEIELVLRAEELILAAQEGAPAIITENDRVRLRAYRDGAQQLGTATSAALTAALGLTRNDLFELQRFQERVARES